MSGRKAVIATIGVHMPEIHGLRGIAALAIVFFHVAYVPPRLSAN